MAAIIGSFIRTPGKAKRKGKRPRHGGEDGASEAAACIHPQTVRAPMPPCRPGSLASAGSLVAVEPSWPALNGGLVQNPLRTGSGANSKLQSISSGTEGSPLACSCSLPVVACGNRLHFLAPSAVTLGYLPAPWARHGSFYGRRRFGTSNASGALHCTSTGHGIL